MDKVGVTWRWPTATGSELVTGGSPPSGVAGLQHGHFFQPTIFDRVDPMCRLGQEEIFGPLLSVIRVPDYDAAITVVNQVRYGLSAAIYTRDVNIGLPGDARPGHRHRLRQRRHHRRRDAPALRGHARTGNGHREAGHAALDTFTEWKSIYVDYSGRLQRAQIDNQPG